MEKNQECARTAASSSSSSQPAATASKLTLRGGEANRSSLVDLWRQEQLIDFTVCAEGVEFKVHRLALAAGSKYFLTLFTSGMRDSADDTLALEEITPPVLKALLAFIYEAKCEIDEGLLTEVLGASARFIVDALTDACIQALRVRLGPHNALIAWRLAREHVLPALEKAAVEAALRGFEELSPQDMTGAEVLTLVKDDRLVAESEEAIYRWCVRWWEAGERSEAEMLAVLQHLRFTVMVEGKAEEFLFDTVSASLGQWPALCVALCAALQSRLSAPVAEMMVSRWGFEPRLIYVLGGSARGHTHARELSTVEQYDPQAALWKQLAKMADGRYMHACVAFDGKIYAAGGWLVVANRTLDTFEVYDPQTDGCQPLAKMSTARCGLGLVASGGKIYAIGGFNGSVLEQVEAYDPEFSAWASMASMCKPRMDHASVVLDGKIYTMGGTGYGNAPLCTVEVYDPQANLWQRVASMPQGLYEHAAASLGGKIYVTGGTDQGQSSLNSVYVYDPQGDAWTQLAGMSTARRTHASAAVGDKLYVFGGFGAGMNLGTAEVYDPASNSWAPHVNMSLTSARSGLVAVAV